MNTKLERLKQVMQGSSTSKLQLERTRQRLEFEASHGTLSSIPTNLDDRFSHVLDNLRKLSVPFAGGATGANGALTINTAGGNILATGSSTGVPVGAGGPSTALPGTPPVPAGAMGVASIRLSPLAPAPSLLPMSSMGFSGSPLPQPVLGGLNMPMQFPMYPAAASFAAGLGAAAVASPLYPPLAMPLPMVPFPVPLPVPAAVPLNVSMPTASSIAVSTNSSAASLPSPLAPLPSSAAVPPPPPPPPTSTSMTAAASFTTSPSIAAGAAGAAADTRTGPSLHRQQHDVPVKSPLAVASSSTAAGTAHAVHSADGAGASTGSGSPNLGSPPSSHHGHHSAHSSNQASPSHARFSNTDNGIVKPERDLVVEKESILRSLGIASSSSSLSLSPVAASTTAVGVGEQQQQQQGAVAAGGSGNGETNGGAMTAELKERVKTLFSKVRHNKIKQVDELLEAAARESGDAGNGSGGCLSVHVKDVFGNTLLNIAAQNGHKEMMKTLLKRGCDINGQNNKGQTALHFCFAYGYTDLAEWLISKGADDQLRNVFGLSCYEGLGPR